MTEIGMSEQSVMANVADVVLVEEKVVTVVDYVAIESQNNLMKVASSNQLSRSISSSASQRPIYRFRI